LHAAQDHVGRLRMQRRAGDLAVMEDAVDEILLADDEPTHDVGMTIEVLRRAVYDQVSTELERALVDRGRERVVDDDGRAVTVSDLREPLDVDDLQRRIGRRLEVE